MHVTLRPTKRRCYPRAPDKGMAKEGMLVVEMLWLAANLDLNSFWCTHYEVRFSVGISVS